MQAAVSDVQTGTYPDLWRKGHYRVELNAELPFYMEDVDVALQQAGYEAVDADQWGRSYRHKADPQQTAEVDESEDGGGYVKIMLRDGGLEDDGIKQAEDQLDLLYDRIHQICQSRSEYLFEPADIWPQSLVQYYKKTPLTYFLQ